MPRTRTKHLSTSCMIQKDLVRFMRVGVCKNGRQIVLLPPFLVWPPLPTHCRCRGQMLSLVTLCDTHIQSAGFPWTRDRSVADAATYTTHNIHKKQTAIPRWDSKPQSKHANGRRTRLYTAWPPGSVVLFLCQDYWLMLIKPDCIKMKIYNHSKPFITFQVLRVVSSWEYSAVKTVSVKGRKISATFECPRSFYEHWLAEGQPCHQLCFDRLVSAR
jgi:hypothetical protein